MAKTEGKQQSKVYLNCVSENLLHSVKLRNGETRISVSGNFKPNEMCSFLVREGAVKISKKLNGAENIGFKNIYLGSPNTHFEVRSKVKVNGEYPPPWKMTASELRDAWEANNAAYKAARRDFLQRKASPQRDVPEVTEAVSPEAVDEVERDS